MLTTQAALNKDRRSANSAPTFQHRHFAWIAGLISQVKDDDERRHIANSAASQLQPTNAHFDQKRFLRACNT